MLKVPARFVAAASLLVTSAAVLSAVTPQEAYAELRCSGYIASCASSRTCKIADLATVCTTTYVYWP